MKKHVPIVLAAWLVSGFAAAGGLDFNQAVRAALVNSPVLESHYREWGVSGAGLAQGGVAKSAGDELPPDTFGGVLALQARDLAGLDAGRRRSAEAFAKSLAAVKSAYIKAVAAGQLAGVRRDALKAAEAAFSLMDGQRKAGSAASGEWLKARQELARARFESAEADAEAAAEKQRFVSQAGLGDVELADVLPELPGRLPEFGRIKADTLALDAELIDSARERDREARGKAFRPVPQRLPLSLPAKVVVPESRLAGEAALEHRMQLAEHQAETAALIGRAKALETLAEAYRKDLVPAAQGRSDETLKAYNGMLVGVYTLIETKREEFTMLEGFIKARRDLWLAWLELEAGGTQIARSR
ncbi:hypothetical protein [Crenobacter cavernae]|uniref:TolC family protein n=1 Tax=Crenobacter cavernae TaxID=2290923 RepID=A0A345Y2B7_9NEIS|nr:hypothetical protein [Crenobacter cavernae]AXK38069.1 hypothetical protein DWG20_00725 [Crenobacter cavernae]